MDETERELMRDQVAATLAAAVIVSKNVPCEPKNAVTQMREVRAMLYPPKPPDVWDNPAFQRFVAEQVALGAIKMPDPDGPHD